jgi:hypothetical protein
MAQVSRPFQIFLVVFVLFAAVWFVALRDHTPSTTGVGSNTPPPPPPPPPSAKTSSATKPVQTSSHATIVHTKTTAKAGSAKHGQTTTTTTTHVTVVKRHASSRPTTADATTPAAVHGAVTVTATATKPAAAKPSTSKSTAVAPATTKPTSAAAARPAPSAAHRQAASAPAKPVAGLPKMQVAVERQLQQGKTVLILFWNPNGSDDAVVHGELPAVQRSAHGSVAVHYAAAKQVGEYGTITNAVQVDQTPTLLIVEPHGQTTTITGLTDAFAIDQAIAEARSAAAKTAAK